MSKIKTREDLLNAMSKYDACDDAFHYVHAAPNTATAREIWLGCDRVDWLVWFGSRHRPAALRAFTLGCADRAVRVYADEALAPIVDAAMARKVDAFGAAYAAAADANYAAAVTGYAAAEHHIQLTEIHALVDVVLGA